MQGFNSNEGDVSLAGPMLLMLGVLGIGGLLLWLTTKAKADIYEESDAVEKLQKVVGSIEEDILED